MISYIETRQKISYYTRILFNWNNNKNKIIKLNTFIFIVTLFSGPKWPGKPECVVAAFNLRFRITINAIAAIRRRITTVKPPMTRPINCRDSGSSLFPDAGLVRTVNYIEITC